MSDPYAMLRWLRYSLVDVRPWPSAMFDGTETAARRIWLVKPYFSSRGQ
jgi:hypothetical protein